MPGGQNQSSQHDLNDLERDWSRQMLESGENSDNSDNKSMSAGPHPRAQLCKSSFF